MARRFRWRSSEGGTAGGFEGGVLLPDERRRTEDRPIELLPLPTSLRVPLGGSGGHTLAACVAPGESVRCGEVIGRAAIEPGAADSAGAGSNAVVSTLAVHASADGTVRSVGFCDLPQRADVPCVEIETARLRIPHVASALQATTLEELIQHVASAGIVEADAVGGDGALVADRLRAAAARRPGHLIIHAMESDPCATAEWRIFVERTEDVLAGSARLGSLMGVSEIVLVADGTRRRFVASLVARAAAAGIRLTAVANRYPQGHPALLMRSVLNREIPCGGCDLDAGALVFGVGSVVAIESVLRSGMPVTHRLITVTGDAAARPGNYSVAIGTPIAHVIEHVGLSKALAMVVVGGPMTGVSIGRIGTVIGHDTGAILLLSAEFAPEHFGVRAPGPCTRCGWCLEDCPMGLDPRALLHAAERRQLERAAAMHVRACIGCGVCSYVCPARLPIAASIRAIQREAEHIAPLPAVKGNNTYPAERRSAHG